MTSILAYLTGYKNGQILTFLVYFNLVFLTDAVLFESYHENLLEHAMVIKTFLHTISLSPKIYGAYQNLCNYLNWQISNIFIIVASRAPYIIEKRKP